jgi:hypothetical protein
MKILNRFALMFGLMTGISTYFALPASADITADILLSTKCGGGYNVNIWRNYNSGELLYRSISDITGIQKQSHHNAAAL